MDLCRCVRMDMLPHSYAHHLQQMQHSSRAGCMWEEDA
jgi:hypothetical protein